MWANSHSIRGNGTDEDGQQASVPLGHEGVSRRMVRSALEMSPADFRLSRKEAAFAYEALTRVPLRLLHARFALIRLFNRRLSRVLDLLDVGNASAFSRHIAGANERIPGQLSLSTQVRALSYLVFSEVKHRLLECAVASNWAILQRGIARPAIQINNMAAMMTAETSSVGLSQCTFVQAFRALTRLGPVCLSALFRSRIDDRGRLFTVKYVGEEGIGARHSIFSVRTFMIQLRCRLWRCIP
jgi:hypothetical protein